MGGDWHQPSGSDQFPAISPSGDLSGTKDTAGVDAALGAYGGAILRPGLFTWEATPPNAKNDVQLLGSGKLSTIIQPAAAFGASPLLSLTPSEGWLIRDLTLDAKAISSYAFELTAAVESSYPGAAERVRMINALTANHHNNQVEDVSYIDCHTEAILAAATNQSAVFNIPGGAARIIGGEWWGQMALTAQLLAASAGAVLVSIVVHNPGQLPGVVSLKGCYLYDTAGGPPHVRASDFFYNVDAEGCVFWYRGNTGGAYVYGNLPADMTIRLLGDVFAVAAGIALTPIHLAGLSGSGYFDHGGNLLAPLAGKVIDAYTSVSGGTTTVTQIGGAP